MRPIWKSPTSLCVSRWTFCDKFSLVTGSRLLSPDPAHGPHNHHCPACVSFLEILHDPFPGLLLQRHQGVQQTCLQVERSLGGFPADTLAGETPSCAANWATDSPCCRRSRATD